MIHRGRTFSRRRKREASRFAFMGCPREWPKPRKRVSAAKRLRDAITAVVDSVDHAGSCTCEICALGRAADALRVEKCWCARFQRSGSRLRHNTKSTCAICADPKRQHHQHAHFDYGSGDHTLVTREWFKGVRGARRRVKVERTARTPSGTKRLRRATRRDAAARRRPRRRR